MHLEVVKLVLLEKQQRLELEQLQLVLLEQLGLQQRAQVVELMALK
jgi:hypothetical protein